MRITMVLVVCLGLASLFAGSASAARPKPYQWTPAQAAAKATVAFGVKAQKGGRYTPVVCKGTGAAAAGRFVAFACSYTYRKGAVSTPAETVRLWVKVRPVGAGGACVSASPSVPAACLRASAALAGDQTAAAYNDYRAAAEAAGKFSQMAEVVCVGVDGWYQCSSAGAAVARVVYTRAGVKVTLV